MTSTFEANFIGVEAIEDRVVTPDGRVTGLGRFKNRNVKIIVLEEDLVLGDDPACNLHPWTNPSYPYSVKVDTGTRVPDVGDVVSNTDAQTSPTTEENMDPGTSQTFDMECLRCGEMVCEEEIEFERR